MGLLVGGQWLLVVRGSLFVCLFLWYLSLQWKVVLIGCVLLGIVLMIKLYSVVWFVSRLVCIVLLFVFWQVVKYQWVNFGVLVVCVFEGNGVGVWVVDFVLNGVQVCIVFYVCENFCVGKVQVSGCLLVGWLMWIMIFLLLSRLLIMLWVVVF